nr:hypothetical protein [Tanacetum cinerariifolium]
MEILPEPTSNKLCGSCQFSIYRSPCATYTFQNLVSVEPLTEPRTPAQYLVPTCRSSVGQPPLQPCICTSHLSVRKEAPAPCGINLLDSRHDVASGQPRSTVVGPPVNGGYLWRSMPVNAARLPVNGSGLRWRSAVNGGGQRRSPVADHH